MSTLKVDSITPNVEATTLLGGTTPALGKVLQVVHNGIDGSTGACISAGYDVWADVDNGSVTITPAASTSKLLISLSCTGYIAHGFNNAGFQILRNNTTLPLSGGTAYTTTYDNYNNNYGSSSRCDINIAMFYLDTPNTTSPVTYKFQGRQEQKGATGGGTVYLSRHTMMIQEIAE